LAQVLRELPRIDDPNLLVSPERLDDAGVYKLRDDLAIVQTLDFFPPLVDDPFAFGQISAANSLSDVYAMGGTPVSCLNIVGFPDDKLPIEILVEILKGGSDKIVEAGAVVAGGHSVRDDEIKYGLSVTGTIDPRKISANDGAKPGDKLVLTKPIGSGNLTTAFKKNKLSEDGMQQCIDVMRQLNRAGAEAMTAVGVNAATDITGFGLLGHANEMAAASGVTITIDSSTVPLMDEVINLAKKKMFTRAVETNLASIAANLDRGSVDELLVRVLGEAQTSGGLLICVPADRTDALVAQLKERGTWCAAVIGAVGQRHDHSLVLR
jgi:selenide,water dikinase